MNTWICSDWHLGETRFEIMNRPFKYQIEMLECLKSNHNSLVAPDDLVYVVGDVIYDKEPHWVKYVSAFNGRKILIRGNQDQVLSDEDFAPYFEQIIPDGEGIELEVAGILCYLVHYPTQARRDRFNLVGHIHAAWKYQLNMLNIGVDANHFRPHNLEKAVPFYHKAICEFFDADVWVAYNEVNSSFYEERGQKTSYFTK